MLEAVNADLVFTISLKRSTQNLQLSTATPADYPIFWGFGQLGRDPRIASEGLFSHARGATKKAAAQICGLIVVIGPTWFVMGRYSTQLASTITTSAVNQ